MASASVLVDQQRLVGILDLLIVACLVIFLVARLSTLLVKCCARTLSEIYAVYTIGLLVVASDNCTTS